MSSVDSIVNAEEYDVVILMECNHWELLKHGEMEKYPNKEYFEQHYCSNIHCQRMMKFIAFAPTEETNRVWVMWWRK